jgi:hypothetical protein
MYSFQSLILFLPNLLNHPRLSSPSILRTPKLVPWQAGVSTLNCFMRSSLSFLWPLCTDRTEITASLLLRRRVYRTVAKQRSRRGPLREHRTCTVARLFTQFHSKDCTRDISYREVVACGHYLATAVSLPPRFFLWANTPQYETRLYVFRVLTFTMRHVETFRH